MKITLTYEGVLYSSNRKGQADQKHDLRRHFHKQLMRLWNQNYFLSNWRKVTNDDLMLTEPMNSWIIANTPELQGIHFVPLVTKMNCVECALEFRLLGPTTLKGNVIDMDNRIKVLCDALKRPMSGEINSSKFGPEENPMYVLTEDDSLVSRVISIRDEMLCPLDAKDFISENEIRILIDVYIRPTVPTPDNVIFYADESQIWRHDYGEPTSLRLSDLSNRELRSQTTQCVYRLKALSAAIRIRQSRIPSERYNKHDDEFVELLRTESAFEKNIWQHSFYTQAHSLKNEMCKRIYGEPPYPSDRRTSALDSGILSGPDAIGRSASYLESLAHIITV